MISCNSEIILFFSYPYFAPLPFPLPTGNHLLVFYICESYFFFVLLTSPIFYISHIIDIIHFLWLISPNIMPPKSMQTAENGKISLLLWLISIPVCVCVCHIFFIHLLMDTCCFHVLAAVNSVALNIGVYVLSDVFLFLLRYVTYCFIVVV